MNELPADAARQAARERIVRTLLVNQQLSADQGVSSDEADEAVLEAMAHIRQRR
jgi:hypothetical protein